MRRESIAALRECLGQHLLLRKSRLESFCVLVVGVVRLRSRCVYGGIAKVLLSSKILRDVTYLPSRTKLEPFDTAGMGCMLRV
jgi:hypothetical protein